MEIPDAGAAAPSWHCGQRARNEGKGSLNTRRRRMEWDGGLRIGWFIYDLPRGRWSRRGERTTRDQKEQQPQVAVDKESVLTTAAVTSMLGPAASSLRRQRRRAAVPSPFCRPLDSRGRYHHHHQQSSSIRSQHPGIQGPLGFGTGLGDACRAHERGRLVGKKRGRGQSRPDRVALVLLGQKGEGDG